MAGLLLPPVLARVLPASSVPAALTVGTATSTASKLTLFRRHIAWAVTRRFVPGVLLGAYLLKYLNPLYLEVFIDLFLLSNLPALLRRGNPTAESAPAERASWLKLGVIGFLARFLSGLMGAMWLLFRKLCFRYGLSRDQVIATRAANEVLLHAIRLALYLYLGLLTGPAWRAGAVAAVLATAGARRVVQYLSESLFQRIGYAAMVLSGVFMLTAAGRELRSTENLRATTRLFGNELEITGWWRSTSLTLELEIDDSPAIEQPLAFAKLPPRVQAQVRRLQRGPAAGEAGGSQASKRPLLQNLLQRKGSPEITRLAGVASPRLGPPNTLLVELAPEFTRNCQIACCYLVGFCPGF